MTPDYSMQSYRRAQADYDRREEPEAQDGDECTGRELDAADRAHDIRRDEESNHCAAA